ncbi:prolipoprotein diacylglyceryl transferase [Janibacter indicus]|uniref:Phosphatidylglycerol--prolipoprotein diacylglyceryl transferase n=1 Tax=Janibacter indicus TaxID=857417 RepID=A0A1L3MH20_9MICO|nr:prolipoprotein diacylglyceryl transferase [Janibacter indicus]APH01578.1 prolipoprotein diacylglyceryl transferase [Janibacter indicus]QOK21490.1 prolipoprotein diacylglyceryl transferase [Janibacter indicus]
MSPAALPSPTVGVLELGPLTIHAYALCILAGIAAAIWIGDRRLRDRGGEPGVVLDVAMWAVPFGIVGGRIYHVITTPQPYFGEGGHPIDALKIWEGGLGIWGAVALGAVGAWIGCRQLRVSFLTFADAVVPGILVAQAIGRWGNWFNNEIYGPATDLPWGLEIHRWDGATGRAAVDAAGDPVVLGTFHPTFLYESLFLLVLAVALLVLDRRLRLAPGQVMALYIAGYPVGRFFIELLRTDAANTILGLRVNIWTSLAVFVLGVVLYIVLGRRARSGEAKNISDSETVPLSR